MYNWIEKLIILDLESEIKTDIIYRHIKEPPPKPPKARAGVK